MLILSLDWLYKYLSRLLICNLALAKTACPSVNNAKVSKEDYANDTGTTACVVYLND